MTDAKFKILTVLLCILTVILIVLTFPLARVIYLKEQSGKNPYYWCDADWLCCTTPNCDTTGPGNTTDLNALYKPYDLLTPGSAYHQNCILPVQNALKNFTGNTGASNFDISGLYFETGAETNPLFWGAGCTGAGGTGLCADPKYNPQVVPLCPYFSFDAPIGAGYSHIIPSTYGPSGVGPVLPKGIEPNVSSGNSLTLNKNLWQTNNPDGTQNLTYNYLTGTGISAGGGSANNFTCPYSGPVNQKNTTSDFAASNTLNPTRV